MPGAALTTRMLLTDNRHIRFGLYRCPAATARMTTPQLVFNGMGCDVESLRTFADAQQALSLLTFDVPGIGQSPLPVFPYRFANLAVLADRILDNTGFGQVDVIGNSWGSALAQQFARDFPDRCRRLILLAPTSGGMAPLTTPLSLASGIMQTLPPATNHLPMGEFYQLGAMAGWCSESWLCEIGQPTLVVAAKADSIVPHDCVARLSARIPHAEYRMVDGDHMVFLREPGEVSRLICRFLNK